MSFNGPPKIFSGRKDLEKKEETPTFETHRYDLESASVAVESRLFSPEEKIEGKAVIFLPGWSMTADSKSTELMGKSLSKESRADTYALTTRLEQRGGNEPEDPLYEEAQALAKFIKEKALKDVTIVGHSQGGDRAVNLATLLQDFPDMKLDGLILINPVGMYEQGAVELATKFAGNSAYTIASVDKEINRAGLSPEAREKAQDAIAPALQAGNDVMRGITKEVLNSKLEYPSRFKSEVTEMAEQNSHTRELTVPIVIVTGMQDSVSDALRIAPELQVEAFKTGLGEVSKEDASEEVSRQDTTLRAREAQLKESLFPKSPYVRMLVPEKFGVHSLPFLRPESVAKTSLYMLERFNRNKEG